MMNGNTALLKAVLIDDDGSERAVLRDLLLKNFQEIEIVAEAADVTEGVKTIYKYKPDLVFLDIDMPGQSGLELPGFFDAEELNFKIVFVTGHTEFAINAFELSAIDYILKPVNLEALKRAIGKASADYTHRLRLMQQNIAQPDLQRIALATTQGTFFIQLDDILYIKADGSYSHFHLKDGSELVTSRKINEYNRLEKMGSFMRIHRSHSINLKHIQKVERGSASVVTITGGIELGIASERRQALLDYVDGFRI
jgi:two-component system LytT family response regulator